MSLKIKKGLLLQELPDFLHVNGLRFELLLCFSHFFEDFLGEQLLAGVDQVDVLLFGLLLQDIEQGLRSLVVLPGISGSLQVFFQDILYQTQLGPFIVLDRVEELEDE